MWIIDVLLKQDVLITYCRKYTRYLLNIQNTLFNDKRILFCRLVHAITPMEENKSFLEKLQTGEKMWSNMHDEGSESLFTSWR